MNIEEFSINYLTPFFLLFLALIVKLISLICFAVGDFSGLAIIFFAPLPLLVLIIDLLMKAFIKKKGILFAIQSGVFALLLIVYIIYLIFY